MSAREQIVVTIFGTIFLFIGLAASAIAFLRVREDRRILAWFGIFSAMYGVRLFAEVPVAFSLLAGPFWVTGPQVIWIVTYVIIIPATLFWVELSRSALRRALQVLLILECLVAIAGVIVVFLAKSPTIFMPYNNVLAIALLLVLAVANVVPHIARRYVVVPTPVSAIGTLILASAVIRENLGTFFAIHHYPFVEPAALALFVFSQGWIAAEKIFADQRRLLAIENELAIAREIQNSILPSGVPELHRLSVNAVYSPMTAVAGDFYWFIAVDPNRAGFLVADVSGHGVPAALIASMIKVAMQAVAPFADDPGEVLGGLQRTLSGQLRSPFVSTAYLWLDTESRKALYSAAGHPPLLRWRAGKLERIESNGLPLGVLPDYDQYPVYEMPINSGDRFLLYTDGVTEPENSAEEAFGDRRLEQVIRDHQARSSAELCDDLLGEIRRWVPVGTSQQDDITLIVIDVG